MKGMPSVWRSTCARVVALGVAIAITPLPVAAAESTPPAPARRSIDFNAAVVKIVATGQFAPAPAASRQVPSPPAGDTSLESSSFFRTPLGLAVIAIVGAGTAYALYSAKHDRIHSTTR